MRPDRLPAEADRPVYTLFAGPNGSGKSTLAESAAARGLHVGPLINSDVIAAALPPGTPSPELVAGKQALRESAERLARGESFSRESTLTSNEIMRSIRTAASSGFAVHVLFVAVGGIEESLARVRHRVALGGHDIPEHVQRRRFDKSLSNAASLVQEVDRMEIFTNPAGRGHERVALVRDGVLVEKAIDRPAWVDRVLAPVGKEDD